ncbi:putative 3-hydroxyacyl-ACP dehydratase [Leishmania major strain Friedlin]|uniref:Putative 3-hydroxyacyl-ACP dehydratase n=1 Tax=Leishmania major TaxID=5664 RepID=Q4QIP9_LEIMA|nr:putative 3-hydroxyacyl-ACP dehydratase [Leishmania major strain Friedlin]CAG9568980.1 3-hydroxyacyl-ACP_dehydratase_-_putative [Leishmania major strain Friedlin]CAJ07004.1 putative 3-hydroxyacyl-ACP dehydratase [Leishmania major strain Friedlin]|eukprot:XP_001680949.1 putative 3-hydroxyacyl-ACP dehydratase [Leishmania major strain Friedlin]
MQAAARRIIRVGAQASKTVKITQRDVVTFGDLIQDHNPIHSDAAAAKAAGFPSPICYGMLAGSLFSGLMATEIPGPNTVYLSQSLRFTRPIFVGDELEVIAKVTRFRRNKGLIEMSTIIQKADPKNPSVKITCIEGFSVGMNKMVDFEGESEWTRRL